MYRLDKLIFIVLFIAAVLYMAWSLYNEVGFSMVLAAIMLPVYPFFAWFTYERYKRGMKNIHTIVPLMLTVLVYAFMWVMTIMVFF